MKKSTLFNSFIAFAMAISIKHGIAAESSPASTPTQLTPTYTVLRCNDGDTCRLKAIDNTQVKVRLIGIDAPEHGKKRGKKKTDGQPGASEAKEYLNGLIAGKSVLLKSYGVDMYGRNLAEIVHNNESVNLKMVSEGWAEVYSGKAPASFDNKAYLEAQEKAKLNKKGVWAMPGYESPKSWRKKNK